MIPGPSFIAFSTAHGDRPWLLGTRVAKSCLVPFTVSHAAVAWPLSRLVPQLPAAALAIGAMSPDFEYLVRLAPRSHLSHTPVGVFAFCLPVAMAAWLAYRYLVRPAALELLPAALATEQPDRREPIGSTTLAAALAIVLGAFSHLAWDAFTHQDGLAVAAIPVLRQDVVPGHDGLLWCQLLQHVSTLVGLVILGVWGLRAWQRLPPQARRLEPGQLPGLAASLAFVMACSAVGGFLDGHRAWGGGVVSVLAFAAVGAMDGAAFALLSIGLGMWVSRTRRGLQPQ